MKTNPQNKKFSLNLGSLDVKLQGAFQNKRDWVEIETTGALFW